MTDKFNAAIKSMQIMTEFVKSDYYKGKETIEKDLKKFVKDNPELIEKIKNS